MKETAETEYLLHILEKSEYLEINMAASMLNDSLEIIRHNKQIRPGYRTKFRPANKTLTNIIIWY